MATDREGKQDAVRRQKAADVRLVSLPSETVAKGIRSFLSSEGYEVPSVESATTAPGITFSAQNQQRSYGKLFASKMPQYLHVILESTGPSQTRAILTASRTPAFRLFLYGMPLLLVTLTFAVVPAIGSYTPESLWGCVLWLLLGLIGMISGLCLFLYSFNGAVHGHRPFLSRLYDELSSDVGVITTIHSGIPSYTLGELAIFVALLFFMAGLTMAWLPLWLLLVAFFAAALLISLLCIGQVAWRRSGAFASAFVSALALVAYGILPYWAHAILQPSLGDLSVSEAIAVPPLARMLVSVVTLSFLSFPLFGLIAIIVIVRPTHFTTDSRSQMERDRTSWQRQPGGGWRVIFHRAFVILVWAATGGLMFWSIYLSLGCLEIALPGHTRIFSSTIVLKWAELNRIFAAVLFGGSIPRFALLPLADTLLLLYSLPVLVLFLLHLREYIRLWQSWSRVHETTGLDEPCALAAQRTLTELALAHGLHSPILHPIDSKSIDMHVGMFLLRSSPRSVSVTTTALHDLCPESVEALLAHEIGHIALGHARLLSWLHALSAFSPCGIGSLTLLCDPVRAELEADQFAVKWMSRKYGQAAGVKAVTDALKAVEVSRISASFEDHVGNGKQSSSMWIPHDAPGVRAFLKRAAAAFRFDYCRAWQLAYVHPSHSDRIAAVSKYGSTI